VWQIVVNLRTNFLCVLFMSAFPRGCEEPVPRGFEPGHHLFAGSGMVALGANRFFCGKSGSNRSSRKALSRRSGSRKRRSKRPSEVRRASVSSQIFTRALPVRCLLIKGYDGVLRSCAKRRNVMRCSEKATRTNSRLI
jgi:hypothetical protein